MLRFASGLLLVAVVPLSAEAFCRQTTNDDDSCGADPGIPLAWDGNCVKFSLHEGGSDDLPIDVVDEAIRLSFVPWHNATRAGEDEPCTYITFFESEYATCDEVEFASGAGNMNLVVFRESGWQTELNHAPASMGLTTVLFDPKSGEILSADMELNGEYFQFTVDDVDPDADLRNTATHEAGHMIGLAHTPIDTATMYGASTSGEIMKRDLEPDDIEGVCTMYPATDDPGSCLDPPGGLDTTCAPGSDGCGCRAPGAGSRAYGLVLLGAIVVGAGGWRRFR